MEPSRPNFPASRPGTKEEAVKILEPLILEQLKGARWKLRAYEALVGTAEAKLDNARADANDALAQLQSLAREAGIDVARKWRLDDGGAVTYVPEPPPAPLPQPDNGIPG